MKKLLLGLVASLPLVSCGWANDHIELVSTDQMSYSPALLKEQLHDNAEYKAKGFILRDNDYAKYLLTIRESERAVLNSKHYLSDPYDTHVKRSLGSITLNFDYRAIKPSLVSETIGFAPVGTYDKGWTGVKEYFAHKDFGVCEYVIEHIDGLRVNKDVISYAVDKKITITSVEGSNKYGYIYTVDWYYERDNKIIGNELNCAMLKFDKLIIGKMIGLANQIEK